METDCVVAGTQKDDWCDGPLRPCPRCRKPVCEKHNSLSLAMCMAPKVVARRR